MKKLVVVICLGMAIGLPAQWAQSAPIKKEDVPVLIKQLKDNSAKMRASAAEELGHIGEVKASWARPAIPALIEATKDKEASVRRSAALALGKVDPEDDDLKAAVPRLIDVLKDSDLNVQIAAAQGLGLLEGKAREALPVLIEMQKELRALSKDDLQKKRGLLQAVTQATNQIQGRTKK